MLEDPSMTHLYCSWKKVLFIQDFTAHEVKLPCNLAEIQPQTWCFTSCCPVGIVLLFHPLNTQGQVHVLSSTRTPWRYRFLSVTVQVLPTVSLLTEVPVAFRSLTNSCCVVLGCYLTFLIITLPPSVNILHGAPALGQHWVCVAVLNLGTNSFCSLNQAFWLLMVWLLSPALCRSTIFWSLLKVCL